METKIIAGVPVLRIKVEGKEDIPRAVEGMQNAGPLEKFFNNTPVHLLKT